LIVLLKAILPELRKCSDKELKKRLGGMAKLICKICEHRGLFTYNIHGTVQGLWGFTHNCETDFAICPNCYHWTLLYEPYRLKEGVVV